MRRVTLLLGLLLSLLLVGPTPGQAVGVPGPGSRGATAASATVHGLAPTGSPTLPAPAPVTPGGHGEGPEHPEGPGGTPVGGRGSGRPGGGGGAGGGVAEEEHVAAVRGRRVCPAATATPQPRGNDRCPIRPAVRRFGPAVRPAAPAGSPGGSCPAAGPRGPADLQVFRC
ncbi:hypothetical protein ACIQBJ_02575 [Kitasatospora sp. NPDC088391]|uniref:hypothetical protein n=1 Tax=Kitasatospora sp. NPDC088391 TaxID=3364074 RepID=UPI00381768E5